MGIIDNVIEVGKKFFPDKNKQLEFELEMRKIDLDEFQEKKGIITKAFHLVFPLMSLALTVMYCVEFCIKANYFLKKEIWIIQDFVPHGMQLIVLVFLSLLMPKKLLEPIMNIIIKYFENKFKK